MSMNTRRYEPSLPETWNSVQSPPSRNLPCRQSVSKSVNVVVAARRSVACTVEVPLAVVSVTLTLKLVARRLLAVIAVESDRSPDGLLALFSRCSLRVAEPAMLGTTATILRKRGMPPTEDTKSCWLSISEPLPPDPSSS